MRTPPSNSLGNPRRQLAGSTRGYPAARTRAASCASAPAYDNSRVGRALLTYFPARRAGGAAGSVCRALVSRMQPPLFVSTCKTADVSATNQHAQDPATTQNVLHCASTVAPELFRKQ